MKQPRSEEKRRGSVETKSATHCIACKGYKGGMTRSDNKKQGGGVGGEG